VTPPQTRAGYAYLEGTLTAQPDSQATVVLLFAAALGISAFFFNHVFGFGGADTTFPLFVFVFLVALGID
jgi:putative drug exporter of the RND superfamily